MHFPSETKKPNNYQHFQVLTKEENFESSPWRRSRKFQSFLWRYRLENCLLAEHRYSLNKFFWWRTESFLLMCYMWWNVAKKFVWCSSCISTRENYRKCDVDKKSRLSNERWRRWRRKKTRSSSSLLLSVVKIKQKKKKTRERGEEEGGEIM